MSVAPRPDIELQWLLHPGARSVDIHHRNAHAAAVLQNEEPRLPWFEVRLPVEQIPLFEMTCSAKERHFDALTPDDLALILLRTPPLFFVTCSACELLDGRHRLRAARRKGLLSIPVLFANPQSSQWNQELIAYMAADDVSSWG